jgi:hypothetical protein
MGSVGDSRGAERGPNGKSGAMLFLIQGEGKEGEWGERDEESVAI